MVIVLYKILAGVNISNSLLLTLPNLMMMSLKINDSDVVHGVVRMCYHLHVLYIACTIYILYMSIVVCKWNHGWEEIP